MPCRPIVVKTVDLITLIAAIVTCRVSGVEAMTCSHTLAEVKWSPESVLAVGVSVDSTGEFWVSRLLLLLPRNVFNARKVSQKCEPEARLVGSQVTGS